MHCKYDLGSFSASHNFISYNLQKFIFETAILKIQVPFFNFL